MKLTANEIQIEIQTSIEGPLARFSTAPRLRPTDVEAQITREPQNKVHAEIKTSSFEVISEKISTSDRRKISKEVTQRILHSESNPKIEFLSSDAHFQLSDVPFFIKTSGTLLLNGVGKQVTLNFIQSGDHFVSQIGITQSDFNLVPITFLKGALRCRDRIEVSVKIPVSKIREG